MKTTVTIRIMETDFHLACNSGEERALIKSAEHLNAHLKEFRKSTNEIDGEKLAIMGGLSLTLELTGKIDELNKQAQQTNATVNEILSKLSNG